MYSIQSIYFFDKWENFGLIKITDKNQCYENVLSWCYWTLSFPSMHTQSATWKLAKASQECRLSHLRKKELPRWPEDAMLVRLLCQPAHPWAFGLNANQCRLMQDAHKNLNRTTSWAASCYNLASTLFQWGRGGWLVSVPESASHGILHKTVFCLFPCQGFWLSDFQAN